MIASDSDGKIRQFRVASNASTSLHSYPMTNSVTGLDWSADMNNIGAGNENAANSQVRFLNGTYTANVLTTEL